MSQQSLFLRVLGVQVDLWDQAALRDQVTLADLETLVCPDLPKGDKITMLTPSAHILVVNITTPNPEGQILRYCLNN